MHDEQFHIKEHVISFVAYLQAQQNFTAKKADDYFHEVDCFLDFVYEEFGIINLTDISKAMVNSRYKAFQISHADISNYDRSRMPLRMFFLYLHFNCGISNVPALKALCSKYQLKEIGL